MPVNKTYRPKLYQSYNNFITILLLQLTFDELYKIQFYSAASLHQAPPKIILHNLVSSIIIV